MARDVMRKSVDINQSRFLAIESRSLSSATSAASTAAASTEAATTEAATTTEAAKPKKKVDDSNIFLDNLGKIFLGTIATIIGTLVRSSYNTSNRNAVRDHLEDVAILDPVEIDDLRIANSELTPEVFRTIMKHVSDQFPHGSCSYENFIPAVRRIMVQLKGDAFTIQLGHCLDRVVAEVLLKNQKSSMDEMPLTLWLATLTLALNSDAPDRIRILYEILELEESPVIFSQIPTMVGYLQETCQLPPDTQIVPTETKYPTQQWEKGTPKDLVPGEDGTERDLMDVDAFASILRSKSVCAWGECYHKKTFERVDG
jgi:hypothetical protein